VKTWKWLLKEPPIGSLADWLIARMFFWIRYIEEIGTGTNKTIHKNISQN